MKHIVIVNPQAGKRDMSDEMRALTKEFSVRVDTGFYATEGPLDAVRYVRETCAAFPSERFRFYACGGDGTLNEVVSGAIGMPNAEVACIPYGSGNDYVKYYGDRDLFLSPQAQLNGDVHSVDVMRVNDRYAINICNFGFDAMVCKTMEQVRRRAVIGGRNAYTTGIVKALFCGRRTRCSIKVDGKEVNDGYIMMCTLGNGRYVGGSYMCSPLSQNDDGLIEVCMFRPMTIFSFARLIGSYRTGTFMQRAEAKKYMTYLRGRVVDIEAPSEIDLCVDGEMMKNNRFHIEQIEHAIKFVVPKNI